MTNHIDSIFIYFKPSHFKTSIRLTNLAQSESAGKPKSDKDKKAKDANLTETIIWPTRILECRNEPIYIFMDTIDTKFVIFSMSQIGNAKYLKKKPKVTKKTDTITSEMIYASGDSDRPHRPSVVDILRRLSKQSTGMIDGNLKKEEEEEEGSTIQSSKPFAYFATEKFQWEKNSEELANVSLNTCGTKATLVDFDKGRFVLRMWIRSDTSYILNILSDSPIVVGNMERVSDAMSKESECLTQMCFTVSTNFGTLVQTFGTNEYPQSLKEFYASYKPDCELTKFQASAVHEEFLKLLVSLLAENFNGKELDDCLFALRVLFLNPNIKLANEIPKTASRASIASIEEVNLASEDVVILKTMERSAVKIQAFFKRIYVRKLKLLHDENDKRFFSILSTLKTIYMTVFGVQRRLQTCLCLLRNLFNSPGVDGIKCTLREDLRSVVHLQTFNGHAVTSPGAWIPVCRYTFYVNWYKPVPVRIHLFCEMRNHYVRVFNNDNGKEIPRYQIRLRFILSCNLIVCF